MEELSDSWYAADTLGSKFKYDFIEASLAIEIVSIGVAF